MIGYWVWLWLPVLVGITVVEAVCEHRSTLADRGMRWPANLGLFGLQIATTAALSMGLVYIAGVQTTAFPVFGSFAALPLAVEVPLFLAVLSFVTYWLHRISHEVSPLWRLHRIHHCDPIVDPTTSLRHHPGEVVVGFVVYQLPIVLLHPSPEAVAIVTLTERCFAAATHTSLTLPGWLERALALVFVTPQQHSVHHSDYAPETNSNYGTVLNLWDRVFGTYRASPLRDAAQFRHGLAEVPPEKAEDLLILLALPALGRDPWRVPVLQGPGDPCPKMDI